MYKLIISSALILFFSQFIHADSPLTSTSFYKAYAHESIIIKVSESDGILTKNLIEYLLADNPIDIKMAVINKLSWDINGKNNAEIFQDYLIRSGKYKNKEKFLKKASADELLCMAYLKALDNYNNVDNAIIFAEKALKKNPSSYTFQIIVALIKAQKTFDNDWCKVFQLTNNVRINTALTIDMNTEASNIIFEYMDLYEDSCTQ